jgi:hypothetical protein
MIFGPVFWIVFILTLISIVILVGGIFEENDDLMGWGVVLILLSSIFGWLIFGTTITQKTTSSTVIANVVSGKNVAFATDLNGNLLYTIHTIPEYNYISKREQVKLNKIEEFNMYNFQVGNTAYELLMEEKQ